MAKMRKKGSPPVKRGGPKNRDPKKRRKAMNKPRKGASVSRGSAEGTRKQGFPPVKNPKPPSTPKPTPRKHIGTTIGEAGKALSKAGVPVEDWFK